MTTGSLLWNFYSIVSSPTCSVDILSVNVSRHHVSVKQPDISDWVNGDKLAKCYSCLWYSLCFYVFPQLCRLKIAHCVGRFTTYCYGYAIYDTFAISYIHDNCVFVYHFVCTTLVRNVWRQLTLCTPIRLLYSYRMYYTWRTRFTLLLIRVNDW